MLILLLIFMSPHAFAGSAKMTGNKAWVQKELTKMGFSKGFTTEAMKYYEPKHFHTIVSLNLLGFLQPDGIHMNHVTPEAVAEATKFIKENKPAFQAAQKTYKVPPHVISSLLWIETRHGDDVGKFHTVSVFLDLLQSDRDANKAILVKLALEKNKDEQKYEPKEIRKLIAERTKKKSQWAREQLIALASIRKEKHLDIKTLRGSYAGAFGLPQFIPSSYRDYATALNPDEVPDLSKPSDAIISVAYYLAESGWKSTKKNSQVTALMKYNNSRDYADSILAISKRVPASVVNSVKATRKISSTNTEKEP